MSLRVISGKAKGRKIKDVPGDTTRPVTDMVKEALFNILAGDVQDSAWWDLFGGTGAIGIEALSRELRLYVFPSLNRAPIETMQANLETTGFSSQAEDPPRGCLCHAGGCPHQDLRLRLYCPAAIQRNGLQSTPGFGCQPELAK